jgi:hypothetical protein
MKYLVSLIKRFLPKEMPKPMGRWSNEYCDFKTNQRVDLSNEDHCGPCGQYAIYKSNQTQSDKKKIKIISKTGNLPI